MPVPCAHAGHALSPCVSGAAMDVGTLLFVSLAVSCLVIVISLILACPRRPKKKSKSPLRTRETSSVIESSILGRQVIAEGGRKCLEEFVKETVIPKFEDQRSKRQFAVLILSPLELADISQTVLKEAAVKPKGNTAYTHPTDVFFPKYGSNFTNFIVARPKPKRLWFGGKKHAEISIFDFGKLEDLCGGNDGDIKTLLLFSWYMPCTACTTRIIKEKGSLGKKRRMVVVYSDKWKKDSKDDVESNRERLNKEGITVAQVVYP